MCAWYGIFELKVMNAVFHKYVIWYSNTVMVHPYLLCVRYGTTVTVVLWSQTLPSGEEGHQTTVGKSSANKLLNRFRNITACESTYIVYLKKVSIDLRCLH